MSSCREEATRQRHCAERGRVAGGRGLDFFWKTMHIERVNVKWRKRGNLQTLGYLLGSHELHRKGSGLY